MNRCVLIGRLTKDPDVKYTKDKLAVAHFTMAVDRKGKDKTADFIACVSFGKTAEFIEKYIKKGTKIAVEGRIQTGSYTKQTGEKAYTMEVVVEQVEFAQSKGGEQSEEQKPANAGSYDDFMDIPDGPDLLPFGE